MPLWSKRPSSTCKEAPFSESTVNSSIAKRTASAAVPNRRYAKPARFFLRIAAGNNSAAGLNLREAIVRDLLLFRERDQKSRSDRTGGLPRRRARASYFPNIRRFDGNGTPGRAND